MRADLHPPIHRDDLNDVLRYWLNAVRLEDALSARPKANRVHRHQVLNLRQPEGIQPYFKLPLATDESGFALRDEESIETPIVGEKVPFTAQWLRRMYRRSKKWSTLEPVFTGMTGWPTVYFPRSEELATLFRFRTHLEWFDAEGTRFEPPRYRDRKAGRFPPPPTQLKVSAVDDAVSGLLPFSLDDRLLTRSLGVADEELADLYEVLRNAESLTPADMIATVLDCIGSPSEWVPQLHEHPDADLGTLVKQSVEVLKNALGDRPRQPTVYGVALVYDSGQVQTTHHLQKDLSVAIDTLRVKAFTPTATALECYLQRKPHPLGWKPVLGQLDSHPLTQEQRRVAEGFLGSTLVAAQGPPGTGKTRLIIDLGAAELVTRIREFADTGHMGSSVLMVSSTNNRAVDNVCDVFQERDIPIALRSGSQNVTATQTAGFLQRLIHDLESLPDTAKDDDQVLLDAELETFRTMEAGLLAAEQPRHEAMAKSDERQRIEVRIEELESVVVWSPDPESFDRATARHQKRLLDRLLPALNILLRQLERGEDMVVARQQWQKIKSRFGQELSSAASWTSPIQWDELAKHTFQPAEEKRSDWFELIEDFTDEVSNLRDQLDEHLQMDRLRLDLLDLRRAHRELTSDESECIDDLPDTELARRHQRLFVQAESVRKAWICLHRVPFLRP